MRSRPIQQRYFLFSLALLCFAYLGFELFYNAYAALAVDEFWFAHLIYRYKDHLPYRDFSPYKTTFGYYLLLLPLLFSHGILKTILLAKNLIAVLNTLLFFGCSLWLTRFFSRTAILVSLVLLIFSELVLSYSTHLRVDLLAYWFCFFSLLVLLEKRYLWAGILIGLGFATSQKTIWYLFASNCALAVYWLIITRDIKTIKDILRFNLAALMCIAGYLVFWSYLADWETVIHSVFYEASTLYQLDWYNKARKLFWSIIITFNPLLFLLWPSTLLSILVTYQGDRAYHQRLLVVTYALAILFCLIFYKQVFPYYMQVTIPVFFILYAAFFTWLIAIFRIDQPFKIILIGKKGIWLLVAAHIVTVMYLKTLLQLPLAYLLICTLPLLLGFYITQPQFRTQNKSLVFNIIAITIVFIGIIYPGALFTIKLLNLNGAYQKANVAAVNVLLQDGSDYIAGVDLIYNKTQPIAGMRLLTGPAVDYLYYPSKKIRPSLFASLYQDPNVTADSVIQAVKKSAVKFYVNNYRMMALPDNIKHFFASQYEHYWGSIYLYAPQVSAGQNKIEVKFSGNYLIETNQADHIVLNNKLYKTNTVLYLKKGNFTSNANIPYRLKLIPNQLGLLLNPKYGADEWRKIFS